MAKKHSMKDSRYVSVITACASSAEALIDMMRCGNCFPHRDQDARRILAMMRGEVDPDPAGRVVQFMRVTASSEATSHARWRSAGCIVLDERRPDVDQLTETEIATRARATTNAP